MATKGQGPTPNKSIPATLVFKSGHQIPPKGSDIRVSLDWAFPSYDDAFVGLCLRFPLDDTVLKTTSYGLSGGQPKKSLFVYGRFHKRDADWDVSFQKLECPVKPPFTQFLTADEAEDSQGWVLVTMKGKFAVFGWPMPYVGRHSAQVNYNAPITGDIRLSDILSGRNPLYLLVKRWAMVPAAEKAIKGVREHHWSYGYGDSLTWDLDLFKQVIPPVLKAGPAQQYPPEETNSWFEDTAMALSQGIVQDVFEMILDADVIRNKALPAKFLHFPLDPAQEPRSDKFYVVVRMPDDLVKAYDTTINRAAKRDCSIGISWVRYERAKNQESETTSDKEFWPGVVLDPAEVPGFVSTGHLLVLIQRPETPSMCRSRYIEAFRTLDDARPDREPVYLKLDTGEHIAQRQVKGITSLLPRPFIPQELFESEESSYLEGSASVHHLSNPFDQVSGESLAPFSRPRAAPLQLPTADNVKHLAERALHPTRQHTTKFGMRFDELTQVASVPEDKFEGMCKMFAEGFLDLVSGSKLNAEIPVNLAARDVALMRDVVGGVGLATIAEELQDEHEYPAGVKILPDFDFTASSVDGFWEIALGRMRPRTRQRMEWLLRQSACGFLGVQGPPGSGKSDVFGTAATLALRQPELDKILVCAPTNVAVNGAVARIGYISRLAADNYAAKFKTTLRYPLIMRGYSSAEIIYRIHGIVARGSNDRVEPHLARPTSKKFVFELSPVEWLLKVVDFGSFSLHTKDAESLFDIKESFGKEDHFEILRMYFRRECSWSEAKKHWDEKVVALVRSGECLREEAEDKLSEYQPETALKSLLGSVVNAADLLGVTPFLSQSKSYMAWNLSAKLTMFDESANLTVPDAVLAMPRLRPCFFVGDHKQLAPTIMTERSKDEHGKWLNLHGRRLAFSWMEHLAKQGWPMVTLPEQLRMPCGGFDMPKEAFYSGADIEYGERCALEFHPLAKKVESWFMSKLPREAREKLATRPEKVQHLFLHRPGEAKHDNAKSCFNVDQADLVVKIAQDMVNAKLGVGPRDISIIAPYRAMVVVLERRVKRVPELAGLAINTVDSIQGQETPIVLVPLTVTKASGPGHVGNPRRLNVAATRHKEFCLLVGDINTVSHAAKGPTPVKNADGSVDYFDISGFAALLRWFVVNKRVAAL